MVFPAGAGMSRAFLSVCAGTNRVPRRRGDEPALLPKGGILSMCSPQARG